ncbi:MAG: hypothetical protein EP347_06030 [Alphaproteobacteria bacterium]|nr:MAG: hypothetical protein EP347_06030 [Alphaproteobacteria bacterium]
MTYGSKIVAAILAGLMAGGCAGQVDETPKALDSKHEIHSGFNSAELEATLASAHRLLTETREAIKAHEANLEFAAAELEKSTADMKKMVLSKAQEREMAAELAQARADLDAARAEMARARAEIAKSRKELQAEIERIHMKSEKTKEAG